jgi:glucosamine 6-phosphate synthetase-like amidotransferase/phosphosugar isomerase protein
MSKQYHTDFVAWADETAKLLRQRRLEEIELDALVEEGWHMTVMIDRDVNGGVDKEPYPHDMLKEIHAGADCIEQALAIPQADIVEMAKRIDASQHVFLTGVGTSYYVALTAQYYFRDYPE